MVGGRRRRAQTKVCATGGTMLRLLLVAEDGEDGKVLSGLK
jgi:hypothetical protein